jgi:general secretion pathway protein A
MYEAFYGLSGKPFQLNPDPSFYFGSRGHKRAFAYLEYGLVQGEGFIVITGEIGAGKTTVAQNLVNHLDRERVVAAQLVSTQLDADDLLRSVATAFGIRIKRDDKAGMIAEIEAYLTRPADRR